MALPVQSGRADTRPVHYMSSFGEKGWLWLFDGRSGGVQNANNTENNKKRDWFWAHGRVGPWTREQARGRAGEREREREMRQDEML